MAVTGSLRQRYIEMYWALHHPFGQFIISQNVCHCSSWYHYLLSLSLRLFSGSSYPLDESRFVQHIHIPKEERIRALELTPSLRPCQYFWVIGHFFIDSLPAAIFRLGHIHIQTEEHLFLGLTSSLPLFLSPPTTIIILTPSLPLLSGYPEDEVASYNTFLFRQKNASELFLD